MKRLIVIGVIAMSASACTGGAGAASTTVPLPSSTTVVDTVAATTTSTSTSSTSTTSSTTTTLPETTTSVVPTEDLIKQAVQDYSLAYHECGVAPHACAPSSFTASQGHSRATIVELATGMDAQGLHFLPDSRGTHLVPVSVSVVSASEATALFCVYDAGTVLGPIGPDGLPTVVNDEMLSLANEYRLYLESGTWLVGEQREIQELGEGDLCTPGA